MKPFLQSGFLLLFIFLMSDFAFSQDEQTKTDDYSLANNTSPYPRKQSNFVRANNKDSVSGAFDYVNDYENIYTERETQFLSMLIADFEKETSIKIVMITFDSTMIERNDSDNSSFSFLGDHINQGAMESDKVFIEICISQRMMQIESNVDMNRLISPHESKRIINNSFVPYFKKKQIFEGSLNGLKALMKQLKNKKTELTSSSK